MLALSAVQAVISSDARPTNTAGAFLQPAACDSSGCIVRPEVDCTPAGHCCLYRECAAVSPTSALTLPVLTWYVEAGGFKNWQRGHLCC